MSIEEKIKQVDQAKAIIRKDLRMIGLIPCPVCGKELHYSLADFGLASNVFRLSMKCESKNCLHYEGTL